MTEGKSIDSVAREGKHPRSKSRSKSRSKKSARARSRRRSTRDSSARTSRSRSSDSRSRSDSSSSYSRSTRSSLSRSSRNSRRRVISLRRKKPEQNELAIQRRRSLSPARYHPPQQEPTLLTSRMAPSFPEPTFDVNLHFSSGAFVKSISLHSKEEFGLLHTRSGDSFRMDLWHWKGTFEERNVKRVLINVGQGLDLKSPHVQIVADIPNRGPLRFSRFLHLLRSTLLRPAREDEKQAWIKRCLLTVAETKEDRSRIDASGVKQVVDLIPCHKRQRTCLADGSTTGTLSKIHLSYSPANKSLMITLGSAKV